MNAVNLGPRHIDRETEAAFLLIFSRRAVNDVLLTANEDDKFSHDSPCAFHIFHKRKNTGRGETKHKNDGLALNYRAAKTDYSKLHVELLF